MKELRECPFCGGVAYLKSSEPSTANHNEGSVHFGVACGEFQCDVLPVSNLWQCTPEDAIKAWNNRPHENKIKADAVKQFLTDEAPLLNSEGLDSVTHCCESILYEERERLHLASDKLKRGEV
jgi:hypothetical protein